MSVVEDLKAARAIVAKGWHKGGITDGKGNYCAVGAMNMVLHGTAAWAWVDDGGFRRRRDQMMDAVNAQIPSHLVIADYNDARSTTKQDVLDVFDKAIANLGGVGMTH